jgi:predicted PurR-regulated permease PerM
VKVLNFAVISFSSIFILYYGKFFLLPLFLALFFYIILNSISKNLIDFTKKYLLVINEAFSFFFIFLLSLTFAYFLFQLLKINVVSIIENSDQYQKNLNFFLELISRNTILEAFLSENLLKDINLIGIFSNLLNLIKSFTGNFTLVLVYLIFIVIEEKFFILKLNLVLKNENKKKLFSKINNDIYNYFRIKTFTSLLTALFTFMILFFLNNELSITFAIFAFFLNFIPYIGSLLAVVLPSLFATIQFMEFFTPILTLILLLVSQIFIGNFLETKLMGKTLNISPIALIIFLSLMGKIWGLVGMFLSVPLLVILIIFLNNFKETKKIAIFLTEKGID